MHERRINSLGVVIIASLLFVLIAAALTVGGNIVGPLLSSRAATRGAQETGDIVFPMPDGVLCRHMSFDNRTGKISGGAIERCPNSVTGVDVSSGSRFQWGGR